MRSNSLFRALRVDKLIYAALEATLMAYVEHDYASVPTLKMMSLTKEILAGVRSPWRDRLILHRALSKLKLSTASLSSEVGPRLRRCSPRVYWR